MRQGLSKHCGHTLIIIGLLLVSVSAGTYFFVVNQQWTARIIPVSNWGFDTIIADGPTQVETTKMIGFIQFRKITVR